MKSALATLQAPLAHKQQLHCLNLLSGTALPKDPWQDAVDDSTHRTGTHRLYNGADVISHGMCHVLDHFACLIKCVLDGLRNCRRAGAAPA